MSGGGTKKDGFTVPTVEQIRGSLGQKLIPVVDRARDINTQLGLRPYRVHLIKTRWSGGKRGRGVEQLIWDQEILPVPLVVDMRSLTENVSPVGVEESGIVQLQKISGRYTEEFLLGIGKDGNPVSGDENVYFEIEFFRRDGRPSEKRRFIHDSAPTYNPTSVEWSVSLVRAIENRGRDGSPEG